MGFPSVAKQENSELGVVLLYGDTLRVWLFTLYLHTCSGKSFPPCSEVTTWSPCDVEVFFIIHKTGTTWPQSTYCVPLCYYSNYNHIVCEREKTHTNASFVKVYFLIVGQTI